MLFACVICTEIFTENSEGFATACGHVFHNACIKQWLEESRTCPECRRTVRNINELIKLHLNPADDNWQNAQQYMLLKDKVMKALSSENSELKKENQSLSKEKMNYEAQNMKMNMLKGRICHLKDQLRTTHLQREEIYNLRKAIQLKQRALTESERKNKELQSQLNREHMKILHVKMTLVQTQAELNRLNDKVEIPKTKTGQLNKKRLFNKDCIGAATATTTTAPGKTTNSKDHSSSSKTADQ